MQVVKISDVTLRRRLDEFKNSGSGNLTLEEFKTMWLETYEDPPAFKRSREKRLRDDEVQAVGTSAMGVGEPENEADDEDAEVVGPRQVRKRQRSGKRLQSREISATPSTTTEFVTNTVKNGAHVKHGRLVSITPPLGSPEPDLAPEDSEPHVPALLSAFETRQIDDSTEHDHVTPLLPSLTQATAVADEEDEGEEYRMIRDEVEKELEAGEGIAEQYARAKASKLVQATPSSQGTLVEADPVGDVERESLPPMDIDPSLENETDADGQKTTTQGDDDDENAEQASGPEVFDDVDDEEIDIYLCTPEEAERKARVWVEFNREYLEKQASELLSSEI